MKMSGGNTRLDQQTQPQRRSQSGTLSMWCQNHGSDIHYSLVSRKMSLTQHSAMLGRNGGGLGCVDVIVSGVITVQ